MSGAPTEVCSPSPCFPTNWNSTAKASGTTRILSRTTGWAAGRRTASRLIKGYGWLDASDLTIGYAENGVPDYGANQMYQYAMRNGTQG